MDNLTDYLSGSDLRYQLSSSDDLRRCRVESRNVSFDTSIEQKFLLTWVMQAMGYVLYWHNNIGLVYSCVQCKLKFSLWHENCHFNHFIDSGRFGELEQTKKVSDQWVDLLFR